MTSLQNSPSQLRFCCALLSWEEDSKHAAELGNDLAAQNQLVNWSCHNLTFCTLIYIRCASKPCKWHTKYTFELYIRTLYKGRGEHKDFRLSHFKHAPNLHFSHKTPHFGPKMLFKHFSDDFRKFQIFKIFRLWGIPGSEKYFFRGPEIFRGVKKCAFFHAARNPRAPAANFENLFHSDIPVGSFYRPVLKFLKNIKKCGLQMIQPARKKFAKKYFSDPGIPQSRKISKIWNFP